MKNLKIMFSPQIFNIFKWAFLVLVGLFIILFIVRYFKYFDVEKTSDQVSRIHSTKISMNDVTGKNLPPNPGIDADKTIAGVDINNNGIRDDVEIAIFNEYPNSEKSRAVLLQYALALQMMANQTFLNEEIATSIMQEKSRAYACVGNILIRDDSNQSIMNKYFEDNDKLHSFVEDKQLNTTDRIENDENFYKKVRSYSDLGQDCDIDLSKLLN